MEPSQDREVIELSDGEDDGSSTFDVAQEFLVNEGFDQGSPSHNRQAEENVEHLNYGRPGGPGSSRARNPIDNYQACLREILEVLPDVSHDHVQQIYDKDIEAIGPYERHNNTTAQRLIGKILDSGKYPKERDRVKELKRKRSDRDIDEEEAAKWKYMDLRDDPAEYAKVSKVALQEAFDFVPAKFISDTFKEHGHYYGSFFAILEAERGYDPAGKPPFMRLKTRRVNNGDDAQALMGRLQMAGFDFEALKKEMDSAFQRKRREDAKRKAAGDAERAEEAKEEEYIAKGEVMDCGCCCETVTIPKMTHCNGEDPHFFCLDCARRNANNDIGNSQYKLCCMDFSGCKATFSREQRLRFLDEKTIEKLERLQQQEEIRLAELDNLSTCPFCDFAAICPSIEVDREFRCHNPHCEEVSCRICKLKSHVPLSCEEHKKENGISERRVIEEARTEALIRTCGKCKVRILKEDGCNKVICTSCYAVLCDYCGKDITKAMYNHFDGEGGRAPPGLITVPGGKCPLYDESNKRKDQQVDAAEKEAMAKVRSEHPELSEEDLKIKFAKVVQQPTSRQYGHHGLNGVNRVWIPPRIAPPPADQNAGLHAVHPFVDVRRPRPFDNNAPGPAVGAAAQPAALGAANHEQPRQWMDAALNRHHVQQAAQQQQAAYLRYMALQQQQQLQQQIQAMRLARQQQAEQQAQQLQQQFQAMRQRRAERQARLHIPLAQHQGVLGEAEPNEVDGAWSAFGNNDPDPDPFAFNPAFFEADGLFHRPNRPHEYRYDPNSVGVEDDALDGQEYRQRAATRLNARIAREAAERANREAAAAAQPRPLQAPRRRNALVNIDPWVNEQAALNNPWLQ